MPIMQLHCGDDAYAQYEGLAASLRMAYKEMAQRGCMESKHKLEMLDSRGVNAAWASRFHASITWPEKEKQKFLELKALSAEASQKTTPRVNLPAAVMMQHFGEAEEPDKHWSPRKTVHVNPA